MEGKRAFPMLAGLIAGAVFVVAVSFLCKKEEYTLKLTFNPPRVYRQKAEAEISTMKLLEAGDSFIPVLAKYHEKMDINLYQYMEHKTGAKMLVQETSSNNIDNVTIIYDSENVTDKYKDEFVSELPPPNYFFYRFSEDGKSERGFSSVEIRSMIETSFLIRTLPSRPVSKGNKWQTKSNFGAFRVVCEYELKDVFLKESTLIGTISGHVDYYKNPVSDKLGTFDLEYNLDIKKGIIISSKGLYQFTALCNNTVYDYTETFILNLESIEQIEEQESVAISSQLLLISQAYRELYGNNISGFISKLSEYLAAFPNSRFSAKIDKIRSYARERLEKK
ncbi:MAG: hypothetical protein ABIH42_08000 [Planctomycetota bacterium]